MPYLSLALAVIVFLVGSVSIYSLIYASRSLAPWIPSKTAMAAQALEYLHPAPGLRFVDLGCGDGRMVFFANRKYGLKATGYEYSILPYVAAKLRQLKHSSKDITIAFKDLYTVPLGDFDIIYVYGLATGPFQDKLAPKIEHEVRPGTYVISYNFSFKNKKPLTEFHEQWRNVYVYQF
jgi:SAM-dependent methyltransferase